ncbi:sulfotransferase family protein [Amaricoccus tamworthensis]|uniref:sulfotransferase family protein n=1 Tax=Amaricoccus tamworthensis TaxID=57002 RepID=UPI003C7A9B6B
MTDAQTSAPRPNIFVVGGSKCGTTSLYRMLQLADGIGTSNTRKELHYFSAPEIVQRLAAPGDEGVAKLVLRDEADYLAEFSHLPADMANIVDVSPSYLQNPQVPARIRDFAPEARIVIFLRNPVGKVFSQYVHLWSSGQETLPFEEAFDKSTERREAAYSPMWDYRSGGFYAGHLRRYLDLFGKDRVRVEIFEEFFGPDPVAQNGLADFMGIRFAEGPPPKINVSGRVKSPLMKAVLGNSALKGAFRTLVPLSLRDRLSGAIRGSVQTEKPKISDVMRARLEDLYRDDVAEVEAILGRRIGWF